MKIDTTKIDTTKIAITNQSPHALPAQATALAAGMDLRAWLPKGALKLAPLARELVPTGLSIALPQGCEAQLRPRSGLAYRQGITLLNGPGTLDADYRGEVQVLLINLSNETAVINDGDRIAQLVVAKHATVEWRLTDQLPATVRNGNGFGSTGIK